MSYNNPAVAHIDHSGTQGQGNWERAEAFINLSLPSTKNASGEHRVAGIPLKASNAADMQLITWLRADPKNIEVFLSKLIVRFNEAKAVDAPFDL